jgi:hypothetical protein
MSCSAILRSASIIKPLLDIAGRSMVYGLDRLELWRVQEWPSTVKRQARASRAQCTGKKSGTLKSGKGGKGGTVKSKKQAIAIGLSEARKKGAKVPKKKSS